MKIAANITELVGHTPLVMLNRITAGCKGKVAAKLEMFNPMSSVEDRIGVARVDAAARDGKIKPGTVVIGPISGTTGIAGVFTSANGDEFAEGSGI